MLSFLSPNLNGSLHFHRFLKKLLTEDLPRLFVRPKKIVLDFQKGKAVGPVANESGEMQEGNRDFVGELSVTLVDARKLSYVFLGRSSFYFSFLEIYYSLESLHAILSSRILLKIIID